MKSLIKRFRAKWVPVRVKKARQNKKAAPLAGEGANVIGRSTFSTPNLDLVNG
ncbi:hypothetical protein JQ628_32790 [Bradyrhizobium lablabi]|uniref:hypothetical protein n=1 Tax=Bradyrhizobium lablabi TaxID=722472 RepID=UPI001BAA0532|nr:hypothetical protein [Bradyrhizobium lablabi]MBR1126336.1 hypothetical protein [Bradyrhizobium lablabi]